MSSFCVHIQYIYAMAQKPFKPNTYRCLCFELLRARFLGGDSDYFWDSVHTCRMKGLHTQFFAQPLHLPHLATLYWEATHRIESHRGSSYHRVSIYRAAEGGEFHIRGWWASVVCITLRRRTVQSWVTRKGYIRDYSGRTRYTYSMVHTLWRVCAKSILDLKRKSLINEMMLKKRNSVRIRLF